MFYAFILLIINYSMHGVQRTKVIKTQKTTTRNLAHFVFIQPPITIYVFVQ